MTTPPPNPPAREEDVAAAEATLGRPLPPWLRDRLLAENGWLIDDLRGPTNEEWQFLPVLDRRDRKAMTRTAEGIAWYTRRLAEAADFGALPEGAAMVAFGRARYSHRLLLLPDPDDPGAFDDRLFRQVHTGDPTPVDRTALGRPAPPVDPAQLRPRSEIPTFRYHPDPVGTGSFVERADRTCPACGLATGWSYVTSPYGPGRHPDLCPWCIADGSAAQKLSASFIDVYWLEGQDPPAPLDRLDELAHRTPGFASWQQEVWQYCCGDACAFHGVATADALGSLAEEERPEWLDDAFLAALRDLEADGEEPADPVPFAFRCLHCGRLRVWLDVS